MRSTEITSEKFFDKAFKISTMYGFKPINEFVQKFKKQKTIKINEKHAKNEQFSDLSNLLQFYYEHSINKVYNEENPLFLIHSNIHRDLKSALPHTRKLSKSFFTLNIFGIEKPYAEALVLSCAAHIFRELNGDDYYVRINSMGTKKDSKEYFQRLNSSIKKIKKNMTPECRRLVENSMIIDAHSYLFDEEQVGVFDNIIPTIRLLSDTGRIHFESFIEYLESNKVEYELAPDLVELPQYGIHSLFEINSEKSMMQAHGGRYDSLVKTLFNKNLPVTSMKITLPEKTQGKYNSKIKPKKPKIFFFCSGEKARLSSIPTISKLFDANIPVSHSLHCQTVNEQLNSEARKHPYIIIFGQEEVENNTICIKHSPTNASCIIDLKDSKLKEIKNFLKNN